MKLATGWGSIPFCLRRSGTIVAWIAALLLAAGSVEAQVQRNFTARYSTNINGDIAQIGNNTQT